MIPHEIHSRSVSTEQIGWATTESIRTRHGERLLAKGGVIDAGTICRWDDVPDRMLHLIELEVGDVHENDAGRRLADAATGSGVVIDGPYNSRFNIKSRHRGLLSVDAGRLRAINAIGDLALFSRFDLQAVDVDETVAGAKATPIVVQNVAVDQAVSIASGVEPIIDVLPFRAVAVRIIATESLNPKLRESFEYRVRQKLGWYGSSDCSFIYVEPNADRVAESIRDAKQNGAGVILAAGGNTLDPLDPLLSALPIVGASMVHFGAPADPGSMFWLAELGETPIFNLASCSMYSEATVIDLMLPLVHAGIQITRDHIVDLGYGGLLEGEMMFRFPPYDRE